MWNLLQLRQVQGVERADFEGRGQAAAEGGEVKQQCPFCPAKVKHILGLSVVKCLCGKWLEVWRKRGQR